VSGVVFETLGTAQPTVEEAVAIATALAVLLADEAATDVSTPEPDPWQVAARIESLGIVRRIPGKLDLRYMGAPTRERLTRSSSS
jgi:hypothetical protein